MTWRFHISGINQLVSGKIVGPATGIIAEMGNGYIPHFSENYNDTTLILGAIVIVAYIYLTVAKERKNIKQGLTEHAGTRSLQRQQL